MVTVQKDFLERVKEIEVYLGLIEDLELKNSVVLRKATSRPAYNKSRQDELLRTMKASALLLLYNLMESTVTNAVQAIYDDLEQKGITYNQCRLEVRKLMLKNLKHHDVDKIVHKLLPIEQKIAHEPFEKDGIVSGNVDAKKIRTIAQQYGMRKPRADGSDLYTVKLHRNDLAHGVKSFSDVGKAYAIQDVQRFKKHIAKYLKSFLANVATYLDNQDYMSTAATP